MQFMEARPDGRAVVYAHIQADPLVLRAAELLAAGTTTQRLLARAVMNGESADPAHWRTMFPTLFGPAAPLAGDPVRDRSEAILAVSLEVADRGEQTRSQFRGAIVEALTERLLADRTSPVRRERRILFDGKPAEIHPYDVTVERDGAGEAWDCKWGARGINADVLNQLDDARRHAAGEDRSMRVGLIVFDGRTSCAVRLSQQTAPRTGTAVVTLETLDALAGRKATPG